MLTDFIDRRTANVYGIYGHLGGGKSLTAVEISLWALSLGWSVTSNIKLFRLSSDQESRYTYLEDFEGVDFWSLPCGAPRGTPSFFRSVIIIDECAEFFDQFSSSSPVLKSFLSWLRHSSKRGQFVFLIVQKPEFIAKSLRLLINRWIICDDMYQFRLPVFKVRIPFTSDLVGRRIFDRAGNLLSRGFNFANKKYFGRYYSTSQSIAVEGRSNDFSGTIDDDYDPNRFAINLFLILYVIYVLFWY